MRRARFAWKDEMISQFLDKINMGVIDVPFLNRAYKWKIKQVLAYLETLFHARLNGYLITWDLPPDGKIKPSCQIHTDNTGKKLKRLILDGGHRTRSLWSIRYGKPIPGANSQFEKKGILIAFNPKTGEFKQVTRRTENSEWLTDFETIWGITNPDDVDDHVNMLTAHYIESTQTMFNVYSKEEEDHIRKNIRWLVEIMFMDFHYASLPHHITLEEALITFRDINSSGIKVNTIDALLSMIFGADEKIGHKIKEFAQRNKENLSRDKCAIKLTEEDVLIVALGLKGQDIHKTVKLIEIYENCTIQEFNSKVDIVIDEFNWKNFENNVVKQAGYVGKTTGSMIFPAIYTLYLDALYNHGFSNDEIYGMFRKLFFIVGILPKQFSGNITDNLSRLLKRLSRAEDFETYRKIFDAHCDEWEKANTNDLEIRLFECDDNVSIYSSLLISVAYINNTKLLFTNNYVRNNLDILEKHHLYPIKNKFYDTSITEESLKKLMNIGITTRDRNLDISNNSIESYFIKALDIGIPDVDEQLELYCLDHSWAEGVNDVDELRARFEERAHRYKELIKNTIILLEK